MSKIVKFTTKGLQKGTKTPWTENNWIINWIKFNDDGDDNGDAMVCMGFIDHITEDIWGICTGIHGLLQGIWLLQGTQVLWKSGWSRDVPWSHALFWQPFHMHQSYLAGKREWGQLVPLEVSSWL